MIKIEFQNKLFGYGKGHVGYAIEYWICILGFTVIYFKPTGIRGVISGEEKGEK